MERDTLTSEKEVDEDNPEYMEITVQGPIPLDGTWLYKVSRSVELRELETFPPDSAELVEMFGSDVEHEDGAVAQHMSEAVEHFRTSADRVRGGARLVVAVGHGHEFSVRPWAWAVEKARSGEGSA